MADPDGAQAPEPVPAQDGDYAYRSFQEYRWDLDKDFLGGLVLALGGYHALAQTASQADIVMHSRIFYYARVSGITIPYAGYRGWLRASHQAGRPSRLWEWELLEALCNHRDRLAASSSSSSPGAGNAAAAAEKARWSRALLAEDSSLPHARPGTRAGGDTGADDESTPSWMAAAPKSELYVDRTLSANNNDDDDSDGSSPAYPERFAAIIKAVQTGEPVEGIVEIPDIVARNPTTTPFGSMARPPKPWEKAQAAADMGLHVQGEHGLAVQVDEKFPDQDIETPGGNA